ncbi:mutS protein homolog 4-like isoform X2 [Tribolium madens]|nr:mutS protein homolog 4-like isoform X2 [Tribolium madens]
MGPPTRPVSKNRNNRQKNTSTPSSGTNWGRSCPSLFNSSVLRSGGTTVSTETESRVIVALTEGRGEARCEVGLASIDLSMPTLILCQMSDSQSYINTLTKINILNPSDIIVPSTFLESNSRLIESLKTKFPNIKILGIPRKTFNKTNGMERILELCLPSINTICIGLQHKYYALAAASALTTYLQTYLNIYYAKESINISYQESEGYAIIDFSTADRLELVSSTKPLQATRYSTLFGVLNNCVTGVGARLLRSTILQPPASPTIIDKNLQCVSELMKHPQMLLSIQAILQKVSNIDQLLTLTSMSTETNDSSSVRQLNYLLLLNGLIDLIEPLKDVIDSCQQPFFNELKGTLESDNFVDIANLIRTMIHPSAQFAKSQAGTAQRCFAIKSGINGLLDLVRKTYSERLNDMTEYVKHLANKYDLPLTLGFNNTKGYHIVFKLNSQQKRTFKKSDLPEEFIQVYRLAGSFTMKTPELINYSTRLEDIMVEILKISNLMVRNIIIGLKQHLGFFYKLCEDIARLDMFQSLAEASRRGGYTRPKFGDFTELTNARHPMLELLIEQSVANPISICPDFNVQVITGPNGSGKSIYIRQVMLLQIMAQVGSYVPADSAIFRPMNRMFARVYLEDDMEYKASSFILEIKEVKYIMTLLSENSLFIIDELCRSTCADEGANLAMAICEKFCTTSAFVYVTTHYTSLANLREMYFNVKTWQMETIATGETPQELTLEFKHRLIPGVTQLKHYGVYIVKKIWPTRILNEVYRILEARQKPPEVRKYKGLHDAVRLKYKLESDMRKLKSLKKATRATINKLLNDYENDLQKVNITVDRSINENVIEFCDENFKGVETPQSFKDAFETSSYRNLSNFIREDSDNINKLIPEVGIECSERDLTIDGDEHDIVYYQREWFQQNGGEEKQINNGDKSSFYENEVQNGKFSENEKQLNNETFVQNEKQFSNHSYKATSWSFSGSEIKDLTEEELQLIEEEFESASRSLLRDGSFDFDLSQGSSYKTATDEPNSAKDQSQQHIFPIVKIIEGPQWSSDSSSNSIPENNKPEMHSYDSESISYSPLGSQFSFSGHSDQTKLNKESKTISSSSLHFIAKNGNETTNLADSSAIKDIENITVENDQTNSKSKTNSSSSKESCNQRFFSFSGLNDQTTVDKESKTSSSSMHFIAVNRNETTNMEDSSAIRDIENITVENFKTSDDQTNSKSKTNSSSSKESFNKQKRFNKRFIPPKKLTRREIQEEFDEQDRKLYEADITQSDFSKYLSQILNRPSIRQIQNSKHLAFVRKTNDGVEVIPAKPEPKKRTTFKRKLSNSNNFDMSIFSDKNAKRFDEFVNSEERDVKQFKFSFGTQEVIRTKPESNERKNIFQRKPPNSSNLNMSIFTDKNAKCFDGFLSSEDRDVKQFNFSFGTQTKSPEKFNFQPQRISDYMAAAEDKPFSFPTQNSDQFHSLSSATPDCYYKENKQDIDNIVNKYLQPERIFETPDDFNDHDLDL